VFNVYVFIFPVIYICVKHASKCVPTSILIIACFCNWVTVYILCIYCLLVGCVTVYISGYEFICFLADESGNEVRGSIQNGREICR